MGTAPQETGIAKRTNTEVFYDLLQKPDVIEAMKIAVPAHVTPERLARIAYTTVRQTPALGECYPLSILMSVMEAAQLGLEPNAALGHAYLVPFDNKKTGRKEAQLMIGFKGKMELARRSKQVEWIKAEVVYAKDYFECEKGLHPKLVHRPFEDGDPGPIKYAYAVAKIRGVDEPIFERLTQREVEKRRAASRAGKSEYGPWVKWEEAMWKKSAIHALSTYLPLSPEVQEAFSRDEFRDMGLMDGDTFVEQESGPALPQRPRTLAGLEQQFAAENNGGAGDEETHGATGTTGGDSGVLPESQGMDEGHRPEESQGREPEEGPTTEAPKVGTSDDQGEIPDFAKPPQPARQRKRTPDFG